MRYVLYVVGSTVGYYCEKWGLDAPIFTGELHIVQKEEYVMLRLLQNNTLFAESAVLNCKTVNKPTPLTAFIEPVRDSSRYFVIRIRDPSSGRSLNFGIGFRERLSAFDLNASINDAITRAQRHEEDPALAAQSLADRRENERFEEELALKRLEEKHVDLSLKAGERIKVSIKKKQEGEETDDSSSSGSKKKTKTKLSMAGGIKLLDGFKLAPPPPSAPTADEVVPETEVPQLTPEQEADATLRSLTLSQPASSNNGNASAQSSTSLSPPVTLSANSSPALTAQSAIEHVPSDPLPAAATASTQQPSTATASSTEDADDDEWGDFQHT